MKKIPKSLEKKIIKCSNCYERANFLNEEIRKWLWKNKLNLNDMLIDSCQLENKPYSFIEFLNGAEDYNGYTVEDFKIDKDEMVDFDDFM